MGVRGAGRTTGPFWTGETISTEQANYNGNYIYGPGRIGEYRKQTVPVDDLGFPANPFGLHHVHGNVWEWVEDPLA
jgi:formylglycine-generating enzyme required for sulfatase activity